MRKKIKNLKKLSILGLFLCMALILIFSKSLKSEVEFPKSLDEYGRIQWGSFNKYTPASIINFDNNGKILFYCRDGKTRAQLKEVGIGFTESQLVLMQFYNLIKIKNKIIKTNIPIFCPTVFKQLRKDSKKIALKLVASISPEVKALLNYLKSNILKKKAYTILFSHILDGIVWRDFYKAGLTGSTRRTIDNPYWIGEIWYFYPEREFRCGTNNLRTKDYGPYSIKQNWNKTAIPLLSPLWKIYKKLNLKNIKLLIEKGTSMDKNIDKVLGSLGIIDGKGNLLIPVIDETKNRNIGFYYFIFYFYQIVKLH